MTDSRSPRRRVRAGRITPVVQVTIPEELLRAIDAWARAETKKRFGTRVTRSQAVRELCAAGLQSVAAATGEPTVRVRRYRLGEEPEIDEETERLTPGERVAMMGPLALSAYEMRGEDVAPRIRRDVVRLVRRGR